MQVLAALGFYGTGAFQVTVGDHTHIHKTTVGRAVKRVSIALAQKREDFIKKRPRTGMQQITPIGHSTKCMVFRVLLGLLTVLIFVLVIPEGRTPGVF